MFIILNNFPAVIRRGYKTHYDKNNNIIVSIGVKWKNNNNNKNNIRLNAYPPPHASCIIFIYSVPSASDRYYC